MRGAAVVWRTVLTATLALALGSAVVGCVEGDEAATPAPSPQASPAVPADALEAFALASGLEHLPRATVLVGEAQAEEDAGRLTLHVVVAETDAARRRGLMGVTEVPAGVGMLFAYADDPGPDGRPGFWMLDTLVELDIVFASEGTVVGVATMVPCAAQPCAVTHPGVDYDVAVEVAAGTLASAGVGPGDTLRWERAAPPR